MLVKGPSQTPSTDLEKEENLQYLDKLEHVLDASDHVKHGQELSLLLFNRGNAIKSLTIDTEAASKYALHMHGAGGKIAAVIQELSQMTENIRVQAAEQRLQLAWGFSGACPLAIPPSWLQPPHDVGDGARKPGGATERWLGIEFRH